jgi:hypothetical protein
MPSLNRRSFVLAVSAAMLLSSAPSFAATPSSTQFLLTAIGRKLDHLQADITTSPLTAVERRKLEARLFDARTDLAAVGEPSDPTESAQLRALRDRLDGLDRLLRERPV